MSNTSIYLFSSLCSASIKSSVLQLQLFARVGNQRARKNLNRRTGVWYPPPDPPASWCALFSLYKHHLATLNKNHILFCVCPHRLPGILKKCSNEAVNICPMFYDTRSRKLMKFFWWTIWVQNHQGIHQNSETLKLAFFKYTTWDGLVWSDQVYGQNFKNCYPENTPPKIFYFLGGWKALS